MKPVLSGPDRWHLESTKMRPDETGMYLRTPRPDTKPPTEIELWNAAVEAKRQAKKARKQ